MVVARDLTKLYGPTRALAGVSLTLAAGTVTSLEGPNGAGKSTLLALLATLARPTAGSLRYGPYAPDGDLDTIRPAIGLVAHDALVYPDLTARESLVLLARLYGLPDVDGAVSMSLSRAGLDDMAGRAARTFSRGQLQRLALARAQLHDPTFLLFDEPTTGLDAGAAARVVEAIETARRRGKIVALVTHDPALAGRVADERVFLERGRVVRRVASPGALPTARAGSSPPGRPSPGHPGGYGR
jgi:heme exporter protein A